MAVPEYPKLRRTLTWKRFVIEGEDSYMFRDDISNEYLRLDVISGTIALALDGTRSVADLLAYARATWPSVEFDQDYIADLLEDFRRFKFIDDPFRVNAMLEARASSRRGAITKETFKNLLLITLGALNPDPFLTRTYPRVKFMFTPVAVRLGAVLFLLSLYWIYLNRNLVTSTNLFAGSFANGLSGFGILWLSVIMVMVIHEFGHAYAVKHHGGKVDTIGFMFMFGLPAMYCDTSDSHLFPNRWHRCHVALAGTYTGFYLMPIATAIWWMTPPHVFIHQFAYSALLFTGVTTIVFNYNPLIKLDGYYVLADLLDMPRLQEDSFQFLGYLFRHHILRMKLDCPVLGRRRKQILALYGSLSLAYTSFFTLLMLSFFRNMLMAKYAFFGAVASLILLLVILKRPWGPVSRTTRLWALEHRGMIRRHLAPLIAVALLALGLFFLVPIPGSRAFPVSLEPARQATVIAPEDMRLIATSFSAGQRVRQSQPLAVLDPQALAVELNSARAEARTQKVASTAAQLGGNAVNAVLARDRAHSEGERATVLERRLMRATLRAPFAGTVLTESTPWRVGEWIAAGETLCVIGDLAQARAQVLVEEADLDDLRPGALARMRLRANPSRLLRGSVSGIESMPQQPGETRQYRLWVNLDSAPDDLRSGLTGRVRIATPARTPAAHFYRWIARYVRVDLWV